MEKYQVDKSVVCHKIKQLALADTDKTRSDRFVKTYYINNNGFVWITRNGITSKADSLLKYISDVKRIGFDREKFRYSQIENDLHALRNIGFDDIDINSTLARLEYYLTKTYMKYCTGQRYGFVNPAHVLNRLDIDETDTTATRYVCLYDIPMRQPDKAFYNKALSSVFRDSVGTFIRNSIPSNPAYNALLEHIENKNEHISRAKYLCNLERTRWQLNDLPSKHKKYVLINLPSQSLIAVDGSDVLSMRVAFGKSATKTPLLTSKINRIDFNPKWIIPRSIIKKEVMRHVDDPDYFIRNNYYVVERKTGKYLELSDITSEILDSKEYRVIQEGGQGNALGRVIFRFDNNFSVYLHDTSNPRVFERNDRTASHGCIRVEKPFDLAVFMLQDKDDDTIEKINYTMNAPVHKHRTRSYMQDIDNENDEIEPIDKKLYMNNLKVDPAVPLFITYYTVYPTTNNQLREYADIYGYDKVIYDHLKVFM